MIMNKKIAATMAAVLLAGGISAFGQGYVIFLTAKNNVYDNFSTSGVGAVAPGDVTATFLWAATSATDPLGTGLATTGVTSAGQAWASIQSMLSSGWSVANNFVTSNEVDQADNAAGVQKGAINYNGGSSFQLANAVGGDTYQFVEIGWDNLTGAGTLAQASDPVAVGWSSSFDYTTGATSGSAVDTFAQAGNTSFGIASVPEPASLALAGLGGLSMLFLRRRKS
jgi:hypothetical protein